MAQSLRVLVIDDNLDDFELIVRSLRRGGEVDVEAMRAETAAEMRLALEAGPWDVVLVDWVLPQFSAPAALQILRERHARTPCIVVSGSVVEHVVMAMKLGAQDFVPKDRLEQLADVIERELLFREG